MVTPAEAEARIRSTFARLDEMRARVGAPFPPDPGSELAADDEDWPAFPVTQVAASSMAAAVDHLQAFRMHVEVGQLFSFAHPTLLRTALLGSAQAVWVLAPDNPYERRARARTLAVHVNTEHLKFLKDLQSLTPEKHAGTDTVAAHAELRLTELKEARAVAGQREKFEATRVIEVAAAATWGNPAATEARTEWRRASGAGHGLMWAITGQDENQVTSVRPEKGLVEIQVGGSLAAVANLHACVSGVLQNAFRLLDLRGHEVTEALTLTSKVRDPREAPCNS